MSLLCLVVDTNLKSRTQFKSVLRNLPALEVQYAASYDDATAIAALRRPNLILVRFPDPKKSNKELVKVTQLLKMGVPTIAILTRPSPEAIKTLVSGFGVADVLTEDADLRRIHKAFSRAVERIATAPEIATSSEYRGFCGFVGMIPSLRERKVLAESGIGLIQNRSLTAAIEYWRKHPKSQLVAVCFNTDETFASNPEGMIDSWENEDIHPWEIGMFEAQHHYLEHWLNPIHENMLPTFIPTMVRAGNGTQPLEPVVPEKQKRVFVKIGHLSQHGSWDKTLQSLKITPQHKSNFSQNSRFENMVEELEKDLKTVDRHYPELTRPQMKNRVAKEPARILEKASEKPRGGMTYSNINKRP